jgi:hypothetical protein
MQRMALVIMLSWTAAAPTSTAAQGPERVPQNLQVLPADISQDELGEVMLGFLRGLGLPRRAGEGCLHCHEGSLDVPRSQWDWASDAKPTKRTARRMLAMVKAINDEYLAGLEHRAAPSLRVGCHTCHAGRVDPRPITDVIEGAYREAGADSVAAIYRELHRRYFGADAYDFRVSVLADMARALAEESSYDDALLISTLNEDTHPDEPAARTVTLALHVQRALDEQGPAAAVARFRELRDGEPVGTVGYEILDRVGWRTFRQDRQKEALVLFRENRAAFPDLYFTFESLVEAQFGAGDIDRPEIVRQYEVWLEEHPGHRMAQQQLTNHRRRN